MDRKDDVEFMKQFREKIDQYLFLEYAPPVNPRAHEYEREAVETMNWKLQNKDFQELRRAINEMTPRAKSLLAQCGVTPTIINYPPPVVGGSPLQFHALDLITENNSEFRVSKSTILDVIDQAIGGLKSQGPEQNMRKRPIEERYVFISHSSKDTIVVSAVKQAFAGLPAKPYFAEETTAGVPPSKEIAEAVGKAEALFVFFTTNTLHDDTRDWIVFEIGVAVAQRKRIYSWKEGWIKKEQLPRLLEQVSKYAEFASQTSEGALKLTGDIRDIAKKL